MNHVAVHSWCSAQQFAVPDRRTRSPRDGNRRPRGARKSTLRERATGSLPPATHPYPETSLTGRALSRIWRSLQALRDSRDPFPGAVIDRGWNVRLTNHAARTWISGNPEDVRGVPTTIFRTVLHPAGLASRTRNFPQWCRSVSARRWAENEHQPAMKSRRVL
ncbi:MmyB family transcriptional regulator [Nocardia africana]